MNYFEDDYFVYVRKPNNIPTCFWKKKCFLDIIEEQNKKIPLNYNEEEFLLVNRLDNDTWWLLIFAKNKTIYNEYKCLQSKKFLTKIYLADVYWKFKYDNITIDYAIMHHKHLADRMVVIKSNSDKLKGRWKEVCTKTFVERCYYDKQNNISTLLIKIQKGIRHQIRVHLFSIWYPIIWDKLYNKKPKVNDNVLHLRSIGLEI